IRKLPHSLVESFKSTLDEVREADLLLHVVDISHAGFEEQIRIVNQTLHEIGAGDTPSYMVFNKIDLYQNGDPQHDHEDPDEQIQRYNELKESWMAKTNQASLFISAKNKTNIQQLREDLYHAVKKIHVQRYPYDDFLY
ncbi:MAG: GTPase HflX, partial [Bacteroidales bacterium]|nr:GTPase HflX [Bacteroidales bacterium]